MKSAMKNQNLLTCVILAVTLVLAACANSKPKAEKENTTPAPDRTPGYGDFLFLPPDSIAIRNFIDNDEDGIDDRYQLHPGTQGYKLGYFYKK
jgi:hypothetical protein